MRIGGKKLTVLAQDTELDGQAAEVLRASMVRHDKVDVELRQGPIESQFFVRGMRWHEDGRTRRRVLEDASGWVRLRS